MEHAESMTYRKYKTAYADCKNLGDYNPVTKMITVIIPDGRMKKSGVRGERFCTIYLKVSVDGSKPFEQGFRAISHENAVKQARKQGYTVQK